MTPKNPEAGPAKATSSLPAESPKTGRKVWKRKTPVEVMIDQIDRLRDDVSEKEEELKQA
nr:hypothetical protein [Ktedonobacteraceae bacterium]